MKSTHFLRIVALSILAAAINAHGTAPKAPIIDGGNTGEAIPVNWNPGHYLGYGLTRHWPPANPADSDHTKRINNWKNSAFCEADNRSAWTGVMIKIHWRNVVYDRYTDRDYTIFDDWYTAITTQCGAPDKRIAIGVMIKSEAENQFFAGANCETNGTCYSGVSEAETGRKACAPLQAWEEDQVVVNTEVAGGHCMPALWRPAVSAHFSAFLTDFATYLNTKPLVEWISFEGEGSKGWVARSADAKGYTHSNLTQVYKNSMLAIRAAAPNKLVGMGSNHFNPTVGWPEQIVQTCKDTMGCGLMWPNTSANDVGGAGDFPHTDAHPYYCANSGVIPLFGGLEALGGGGVHPEGRVYNTGGVLPPPYTHPLQGLMDHCCDPDGTPEDLDGTYDGYCATHPWWRPEGDNDDPRLNENSKIQWLRNYNSSVFSTACPSNVTDNGGTCVTGGS